MRKKIFRFHIVLFTFISLWLQAQVIRVAPTPSGSGNGSSWANASSLQNAIAIASSNSQIWVKQGNYPVSSTLLVSLSNISIYGGFAGNETALNQRDWTNNTTVFNGQNTVKIMRFSSNNGIIDGIHFRNGFVTGTVDTTNDGGGALRLAGHDQIIRNCTFLNNRSTAERGAGAIFIWFGGGQLIQNCSFENNTHIITTTNSNGGGAIHNWDEDVTIRNCRFINNSSSRSGGAIYSWGENFNIEGSRFVNNHSDDNGGAIHINSNDLLLTNSFFSGNTADDSGGAIHNDKLLKVSNSLFINNNASNLGGAIYNREELAVTNSTFVNNNNTAIIHSRFSPSQFFNYSTNIYNSIFYGNTPKAADFFSDISPSTGINSNDDSEKDIRRNIVQEYNLGTNNMIGVNPQFVNNTNNFRLQTFSPAVNAGNNALYNLVSPTNAGSSTDLDGNPRLYGTTAIDYGAYELQQIITPSVPACTSATIPANGATNIGIATNFSWTAVTGATSYTLQIGTASGTWNILNQNVGNVTTFDLPNDLNYSTQYFVRIIPRNSAGNATGCTVTNFTTEAQPITVPACTAATIPANGATNVGIATNFSWTAVTGATSYTLQIGTASGTWDILNQNVGNVTTFDLPNNLNYSTQYFVRIIPSNSAGSASGCSVTNFTTEAQPITVPACTSATVPANGATNIGIATNFSWTAVTGATSYTLQIGTASGTWDILNQNVGNVTTFDLPNNLNYSTQYFVRIIPSNSAGSASGCSVTNFTTEAQPVTVPACTSATIPANGATNIGIATNFSWTAVTGATSYTLQIGTASGTWDILNQNVGNVTTFDLPNDLNYSTQYFVRIIPSNSAGPASGCSVTNFITEAQPITVPACTSATIPANGATNIGIATNFSWNAVTGATSYTLQIGTASGTWDILNQNVGNVTTFDLPNNLNYSTQYFVRIIPSNSAGSASGCSVTNFTTEAQPITVPACTSATVPANGATNIGIATNFSWTAVTGATSYTLQIGTASGTWDILNQNVGNVTTFDLPNNLNYSTQYFVRIIPSNSAGSASGCSVTNFTTEAQPVTVPACTSATIPANGATNIGIATNFSWTAVTGATSYTLQIGTASGTWDILNLNVGNVTTFDLPNDLNYSTQYFVRIIPSNSAGPASGCSVTNFITEAQPITVPACTSATIPANGATNIGIATNFSWNAVTGATSYTLQIGTVSGTWNILNQNVGNVTTFDLPNNLNYSTQYFVRIIPSNSAGPASGCSVTNFITVYGDEDGDGVTDDKDQCPNTPLGIPVDSNGCPVCSAPLMTTINIQENDAEISISGGISPFNYRVDNGLWQSTSSNSIVLNDLEGGLHTIEINSADTCETILEFSIIEIHNVITPNGDGINDVLDLSTLLLKEEPKLIIVDRYSNKIFEGNANNQFIWDGKLNGRPIKTNSYWFYIEWKEPNSQTLSKKQGWILVKNR